MLPDQFSNCSCKELIFNLQEKFTKLERPTQEINSVLYGVQQLNSRKNLRLKQLARYLSSLNQIHHTKC